MLITRLSLPALRPFVARLWAMSSGAVAQFDSARREHVLPTGQMHLVFRLFGPSLRIFDGADDAVGRSFSAAIVGGVRSAYYVRDVSMPSHSVGVLFQPGAALALLGAREDEMTGRHLDLDVLWGSAANAALDRLSCAMELHCQLDILESLLLARLPAVRCMHPAIAVALGTVAAGANIVDVCRDSGFSHRHFSALFRRTTGLAPKTYGRVMRFQAALLRVSLRNESDLATLALEAGYCDQSHFNRDFQLFTGVTPTVYRKLAPEFAHHLAVSGGAGVGARGQISPSRGLPTDLE